MTNRPTSKTFTIAITSLVFIFLLALAALVLVGFVSWMAPEQMAFIAQMVPTLGTFALALAGAGGVGAGSIGYRDAASGGLTSSSAAEVLAGMRLQNGRSKPE
jgi:hypothetical protein